MSELRIPYNRIQSGYFRRSDGDVYFADDNGHEKKYFLVVDGEILDEADESVISPDEVVEVLYPEEVARLKEKAVEQL